MVPTQGRGERVRVEVLRLPGAEDLPLPAYATPGASGMDLLAAVDQPVLVPPLSWRLIPTGLAVAVPPGYEAQVRARSGLAMKHGVAVLNAPGTIDSDYRGPVGVILFNLGNADFEVRRGDRIAQLIVQPVVQIEWSAVAELPPSERGAGGFGHTGLR